MSPTVFVAYLTLFVAVGVMLVLLALALGRLLRPSIPTPQKLAIYECGEPAIEHAGGQFDLRFYVVALLFLVFEVEAAFLFPPAIVFGRHFREDKTASAKPLVQPHITTLRDVTGKQAITTANEQMTTDLTSYTRRLLAAVTLGDLVIFFGLLLVGFGYIWRCGDLDWVRALRHPLTPAESAAITAALRKGGY